jgi:hypothetical protein
MFAETTEEFITVLRWAAAQAVGNVSVAGRELTLRLKGGEELVGVPERVRGDLSNTGPRFVPTDEERFYGPLEFTIQLAGTDVLAQEVQSFTFEALGVSLPGAP